MQRKNLNCTVVWLSVFFLVLLGAVEVAHAQVTKGSISGTIVDASGAVISDATLKATDTQTGAVFQVKSERSGEFHFSLIPPGTYRIEISKIGFGSKIVSNVVVSTSQDAGLGTVSLGVAGAQTTVEVSASATQLIETTQAQITDTFPTQDIQLFTNVDENQGLDNLALLVPGVNASRDLDYNDTNGAAVASNGSRGRSNDEQIDGQNNNDNSVTGPALAVSDAEFASEYQIVTNNFGPEYGRNGGSVIDVVTKSGTNNLHGSIYGYWTNSDLEALSTYEKSYEDLKSQPRSNTEFGGFTVGFPIVKDRLFFFNGFDEQLYHVDDVSVSGSATPTATGLAEAGACSFVNSNALDALETYGPWAFSAGSPVVYGAPIESTITNGSTSCPIEYGYVYRSLPESSHEFNWLPRVDYSNGRDTFVARYIFQRNNFFDIPDNGPGGWFYNEPALAQAVKLGWTRAFTQRMVNELSFGYGRQNVQFGSSSDNSDPSTADIADGVAHINIGSSGQSFGSLGYGPADNLPQGRVVNNTQIQDNFTYQMGKHHLKAGINWTFQKSPNIFLPNINGTFDFGNWSSYLTSTPSEIAVAEGNDRLDFKEHDTFIYGGDDWQVTPNLTLNLGLTWTFYGQPANLFHQEEAPIQSGPNPLWNPSLPLSVTTFPILPSHYNLFGPGAGFAWTPGFLGSGRKTVLRGGYRLAYDPPFYNIYLNVAEAAPQVLAETLTAPLSVNGVLPANPAGPNVRSALSSSLVFGVQDPRQGAEITVSPNFTADYVSSWSFGIQHEISSELVAEARYVGNKGGNLFQTINDNPYLAGLQAAFPGQIPSSVTVSPVNNPTCPQCGGREDGTHFLLRERTNTAYSNYNALQTELRANNLFHQALFTASYTWSKTTDNASEIFSNGAGGVTSAIAQDPLNYTAGEHGLSGLDFPQNLTINFVEQIPAFKQQQGMIGRLLGGWDLSGTYYIASGQTYTPIQYGLDYYGSYSGVPDYTFNAEYGAGPDDLRPFLGSRSANVKQVGMYAGDACNYFGGPSCAASPNQLVSLNSLNQSGGSTVVNVTNNQVRYIVNSVQSQAAFGSPWGNVARNDARDAWTNTGNFSLIKAIRLHERMQAQLRANFTNVFNHPNYSSVDPYLDDAGYDQAYAGFGNPEVTSSSSRTITFSARIGW
ncbi:MAG TPA: carboxypeptidase-like regulatory domain-containing protein [Terracidiphilus sp.]|nr:carboxypeptidase-like regulatory domain-containing protein [Terracidiphilus sp.]